MRTAIWLLLLQASLGAFAWVLLGLLLGEDHPLGFHRRRQDPPAASGRAMHAIMGIPVVWLHGEIKTPPFSSAARIEAGMLLRANHLPRGC